MITSPQLEQFFNDLKGYISLNLDLDNLGLEHKQDNSPVTIIDQAISDFCKNHPFCKANFYSEEDHDLLQFPSIVLDPIDGTKELVKKNGECSVSIAWMETSSSGSALIYNPFTGFTIATSDGPVWKPLLTEKPYLGLVSRTEYAEFEKYNHHSYKIVARGSIAYKLGLLSSGACDFVVSLKPKNIWDIAAGTLLGWQRGFVFMSEGKIIKDLSQKTYNPPLIWSKPDLTNELAKYFSSL